MILGKTILGSKFYAASYYVTKISQDETQVFRTDVIQCTVQYLICWPLGRTAKWRSRNKNSCKMRAYFWLWIVLRLPDVIKSLEF